MVLARGRGQFGHLLNTLEIIGKKEKERRGKKRVLFLEKFWRGFIFPPGPAVKNFKKKNLGALFFFYLYFQTNPYLGGPIFERAF